MLSYDSLIQLVFAYEDEIYYQEDMTELALDQYLWMELCHGGAKIVFVRSENGKPVSKCYGKPEQRYNGGLFGTSFANELKDWLQNRVAVVCSLEDFYALTEDRSVKKALMEYVNKPFSRHGTIVLKVSPVAEYAKPLLLTYRKLFEELNVSGFSQLRPDKYRVPDMFHHLKRSMDANIHFFCKFEEKRIRSLLQRLMLDYPERNESSEAFQKQCRYLTSFLNTRELQWTMKPQDRFFDQIPDRYSVVYQQLRDEDRWKLFCEACASYNYNEAEQRSERVREIPIIRETGNLASKCLKLMPLQMTEREKRLKLPFKMDELLNNIRAELQCVSNQPENEDIKDKIDGLLQKLYSAEQSHDIVCYPRILFAIFFHVRCWYLDNKELERVQAVFDFLQVYVQTAEFYSEQEGRFVSFDDPNSIVEDLQRKRLKIIWKELEQLDASLPFMVNKRLADFSDADRQRTKDMTDQLLKLKERAEEAERQPAEEVAPVVAAPVAEQAVAEPIPEPEETPEERQARILREIAAESELYQKKRSINVFDM